MADHQQIINDLESRIEELERVVDSIPRTPSALGADAAASSPAGALGIGDYKDSEQTANHTDSNGAVWHINHGTAISRTTYSTYYSMAGTRWGVGDGSTTFNIADAQDRYTVYAGYILALGDTDGEDDDGSRQPISHDNGGAKETDTGYAVIGMHDATTDAPQYWDIEVQAGTGATVNDPAHQHYLQPFPSGGHSASGHKHTGAGADTESNWPPHLTLNKFVRVA